MRSFQSTNRPSQTLQLTRFLHPGSTTGKYSSVWEALAGDSYLPARRRAKQNVPTNHGCLSILTRMEELTSSVYLRQFVLKEGFYNTFSSVPLMSDGFVCFSVCQQHRNFIKSCLCCVIDKTCCASHKWPQKTINGA